MSKGNATWANSVCFHKFKFYGYTFEVPIDQEVHGIQISQREYLLKTDKQTITLKACHKCKRLLPLERFYERKSPCKACHIVLVKSWEKRNPDLVKKYKQGDNRRYRQRKKLELGSNAS